MPYITQEQREAIETFGHGAIKTAGELNYYITRVLQTYLLHNQNYGRYNEVLGVLEAVKLELYRRKVAPYEDKKIKENGDVW